MEGNTMAKEMTLESAIDIAISALNMCQCDVGKRDRWEQFRMAENELILLWKTLVKK